MCDSRTDLNFEEMVKSAAPSAATADLGQRIRMLCGFLLADVESGGKALGLAGEPAACASLGAAGVAAVRAGVPLDMAKRLIERAYKDVGEG